MKKNIIKLMTAVFVMAATAITTVVAPVSTIEAEAATVSANDQALIRGMFDATFYAKNNPDVVAKYGNNTDKLYEHFINFGIFEGRQPSADFNVNAYASSYSDLARNYGADVVAYYRHYANYGKSEGRKLTTIAAATAAGKTVTSVTSGKVIANDSVTAKKAAQSNYVKMFPKVDLSDPATLTKMWMLNPNGNIWGGLANATDAYATINYHKSTRTVSGAAWYAVGTSNVDTATIVTAVILDKSLNPIGYAYSFANTTNGTAQFGTANWIGAVTTSGLMTDYCTGDPDSPSQYVLVQWRNGAGILGQGYFPLNVVK